MNATKIKNRWIKKLHRSEGETLVEALLGALVAGIALLGFFSMIIASNKIMERSDAAVKTFYENINAIEQKALTAEVGTITITDEANNVTEIQVNIFKTKDNRLAAYDLEP